MTQRKPRWAFFSYAHNLGDFTRALETAKEMNNSGAEVCFFNHGGTHINMIEKAGLKSVNLQPVISSEQDQIVMAINQFRTPIGTPLPFTEEELTAMVEADIKALKDYKPDAVYCGLNISSMISVPYMKIPRVTMVPTTLCPAFYKKNLATFPNTMESNFFVRYCIPAILKRRFFNAIMLKDTLKSTVAIFNKVREKYNLSPIYNSTEFVKSDLVLLPDLPELSGLPEKDLPDIYKYTGPIFALMDIPVAEEIKKVFSEKGTNIFVSLGSSGSKEVLKTIIETLVKNPEYNIVCSTTTILDPKELGKNTNKFFASRFIPAHLVNEMANIAITHGGQGTIQTAVWSGTPVIGIGFQSEQQANIDGLVRAGMAVRIALYNVTDKSLTKALNKVNTKEYKENALRMKQLVRKHNGVKVSVEKMNELILM